MSSIPTTSFEPLMPESLEDRWIDYYSGRETSPYCDGSAVSMPFKIGTPLYASDACPPGSGGCARYRSGHRRPRARPSPSRRIRRPRLDLRGLWAGQSAAMRSILPIVLTSCRRRCRGCALEPFQKTTASLRRGQAQPAQRPAGSGPGPDCSAARRRGTRHRKPSRPSRRHRRHRCRANGRKRPPQR